MIPVRLQREGWADPDVPLPHYATEGAAGADLRANLPARDRAAGITLAPLERRVIPTGFLVEIAPGHELQIRPRSGLALKHGLTLPNSPGTIDCDYRGPLGVLLVNLGREPVTIRHGERIAQAVLAPVLRARFEEVAALSPSVRGAGGFGSTGRD